MGRRNRKEKEINDGNEEGMEGDRDKNIAMKEGNNRKEGIESSDKDRHSGL